MGLRDTTNGHAGDQQAVIDIGSNTVRLVIYGGPARAPVVLLNEKVSARLGKGAAEHGKLSDKAMNAALTALGRYAALLRARGIRRVYTVATAATRDASNGAEFLGKVAALGLNPRLLSGEEEALTSAAGVAGAFPNARGVVAALGGGSLELVHIAGTDCEHGSSLPLGTLRLPALRSGGAAKFKRKVEQLIEDTGSRCAPGEALYLVGGSLRALARYHQHLIGSPIDDPHGLAMEPDALLALCRKLQRSTVLPGVPGVAPARLATLPDTAALLAALIAKTQPSEVIFSGWGLREGLIFDDLPPAQRRADPFAAGVRAFAEPLGASPSVAAMIAGWTAGVVGSHDYEQENLRLSATVLAIASQQVEPNLRSVTVVDWALHKRWIGIGGAERAMLAACLLANVNREIPVDIELLARPEQVHQAISWGLSVRLCRRLTGLAPQLFSSAELAVADGQLVLTLAPVIVPLATEVVEKDLKLLAEHLSLKPVIEQRAL